MRDLKGDLNIDGIDFEDVISVFSDYYSRYEGTISETVYIRDVDTPAVRISHNSSGHIKRITSDIGWDDDDLIELKQRIKGFKERKSTIAVVSRYVLTFLDLDNHALGVRDWFVLRSAPPEAPRTEYALAGAPAILEVVYNKPRNELIAMRRREDAFMEVELLLNVLYKLGVKSTRGGLTEWGIPAGNINSASVPFHLGYSWPTMAGDKGKLSDISAYQSFMEIAPERYYLNQASLSADGSVAPTIGSDFAALVGSYRRLSSASRTKFVQAAYWFQYSSKVLNLSRAASFLALVQAIEALIDIASDNMRCPTCNNLPGAVKRFHDFVERYAEGTPKKRRDAIYKVRSSIVHGGHRLRSDAAMFTAHPSDLVEQEQHRHLGLLVRLILRNWLAASGN